MRVVPIINADANISYVSECEDGYGVVPKLDIPLTRRSFLKGSGIVIGTIAAGSAISLLGSLQVVALIGNLDCYCAFLSQ